MPYIPHTPNDIKEMQHRIGISDTNALFDEIPADLRYEGLAIPDGLSEMAMLKEAQHLASLNQQGVCFIGAGSYEHHIPAAVWDLASRGEFLTAYTPYQAEASQGTLQLLYEYQTMMAELTGMEVSNASLYDGATALAEAVLMATRLNKRRSRHRILVAGTLHPLYWETLTTIVGLQHIECLRLDYSSSTGTTPLAALEQYSIDDVSALIIPQPNFFGCLEDVDRLSDWAHQHQIISIACVNPISLALLKPPGQWGQHGVDIVCGEGQPLGVPMASGGPYLGFFCTRMSHVRQMPGRLIGKTVDVNGKEGFTLTLQAREQHIRREKATSNICTNQGLLVTAATIYMSLLGAEGMRRVAEHCHQNTQQLVKQLTAIEGVKTVFSAPYFHEVLLRLNEPVEDVLRRLEAHGIHGGYPVEQHFPELSNTLLVCATEMRTDADIQHYAQALKACLTHTTKEGVGC